MFDTLDALPADPLGDVWWKVARVPPSDPLADPAPGEVIPSNTGPSNAGSGEARAVMPGLGGARWWRRLLDGPPGGVLAAAVQDLTADGGVADVDDDTVVAVAAAAQRVLGWAMGAQLVAVAELGRRWQASPLGERAAVAELALACGVSEYAMGQRLDASLLLPYRLPAVWAALTTGRLEWAKAWEILDKTLVLSDAHTALVEPGALQVALTSNLPDLRAHLAIAVLQADPDGATERAKAAHARRGITFRPGPDATATLALTASAAAIAAAEAALNRLTAAAGTPVEDQHSRPETGPADAHPDQTGHQNGHQDALADARPERRSAEVTRADVLLDLIHTADAERACSAPPAGPLAESAESTESELADTPRRHHRVPARGRAQIVVTVPLSTLLALSEHPGDLAGYGPIPAAMARDLITHLITDTATSGTWRCAVTEDRPGQPHATLLALGRSTYTPAYLPTSATRDYLAARDGTCRFPGCRHRAARPTTDLDHRTPWNLNGHAGSTCECNLQALCRHHHPAQAPSRVPRRDHRQRSR